ncbi:MAG: CbiX/SirB N-terminal domain-containing protein [Syntrophobacteraceae bacterium]
MANGETFEAVNKSAAPDEAIILLGHGSRVPEAAKDMERVAARLRGKYGYPLVEVCFLSRLGPHFPEVFEKCVKLGVSKVLVIPYFLHSGLHLVLDVPEMLQRQAQRFPAVTIRMGRGFGFDELLVDLVQTRIQETRGFGDVRQMVLPPKEMYPVPSGQCEFVPMPPDKAVKYRTYVTCEHCDIRLRLVDAVRYEHRLLYGQHYHCRECDAKGVWNCMRSVELVTEFTDQHSKP